MKLRLHLLKTIKFKVTKAIIEIHSLTSSILSDKTIETCPYLESTMTTKTKDKNQKANAILRRNSVEAYNSNI